MHVLQSSFEERRPDFISEKSQNNLKVPNILERNVSFLKNQFLASFFLSNFITWMNLLNSLNRYAIGKDLEPHRDDLCT